MLALMLVSQLVPAPEGCTFALTAYDGSLGRPVPLKIEGVTIGSATLISAIPSNDRRMMSLTFEVDEASAEFFFGDVPVSAVDDYVPDLAFDPHAALEKLRLAQTGAWTHIGKRMHETLCVEFAGTYNHAWTDRRFPCGKAIDVAYDWLRDANLDAGIAIANDARVGYMP